MKRKKPPIALISVMVVAALGLVISGKAFSFYNKTGQEQLDQLRQEAEERERAKVKMPTANEKGDSSKAVADMKAKMAEVGKPQIANQAAMVADDQQPGGRGFKTSVPTVIMPDQTIQKPKPNTAAPSPMWYDDK
jgi:hypothetical protein